MDTLWSAEIGVFLGAIPVWLASLFYAWSYSVSPTHHILPKCVGWMTGFPVAFIIGGWIGYALAPNWWQWAYTVFFGGYGFLLVWLSVAIFGTDDFIEWARERSSEKTREYLKQKNPRTRPDKGFTAPDRAHR